MQNIVNKFILLKKLTGVEKIKHTPLVFDLNFKDIFLKAMIS